MSSSSEVEDEIHKQRRKGPRPVHRYNDDERLTLCLMSLFFESDYVGFTAIFNSLYSKELEREGFEDGLQPRTIQSQLNELKHFKGGYSRYSTLCDVSLQEIRKQHQDRKNDIEDAAMAMNIQLQLRISPRSPKRPLKLPVSRPVYQVPKSPIFEIPHGEAGSEDEYRPLKKLRRTKSAGDLPQRTISHEIIDEPLVAKTSDPKDLNHLRYNKAFQQILQGKRVLLKSRTDSDGKIVKQRDALLFRTTSSKSATQFGYRAGLFKDSSAIPPPAEDNELKEQVQNHLKRENQYSPLISLYAGPRPVFSRALQADLASSARILIIGFEELERGLKRRFPDSQQNTYWVRELIVRWNLGQELHDYGWMAYGTIEDAIIYDFPVSLLHEVSDLSPKISELLQFDLLCSTKDKSILPDRLDAGAPNMDRATGRKISELLNKMEPYFCYNGASPDDFREVIAAKIASSWRFKGYTPHKHKVYVEYMKGVFEVSQTPVHGMIPGSLDQGRNRSSIEGGFKSGDKDIRHLGILDDADPYSGARAQSPVYDFDSDDEQGLIDQQLAASSAEFQDEVVKDVTNNHVRRLSLVSLTGHSTRSLSLEVADQFTLQLLRSAEEPTPTPQTGSRQDVAGDGCSGESEVIDLTQEENDDFGEAKEAEDAEEEDEIMVISTTFRANSVLSIRTRSTEPAFA